jgi:transcription elongation factor Elf1
LSRVAIAIGYARIVLSRRRFMFLLGGATTGLWLASTGLVRLQRSFVLSLAGSCSFCGKDRAEVHALVGTAGHATRICDDCIGLCCDILAEEVGIRSPEVPANVPPTPEDLAFQQRVGEALQRFAAERESRQGDALLDDLQRALTSRAPESVFDLFRCSFCGAHRREVMKLISGPRVFICDACVGEATAIVTHVLRAA